MALLAAWCAMRFGELTELRRGDIDLRTNRVKIRRGVVRVDGKFIVGQPKSDAGSRDVAIPPDSDVTAKPTTRTGLWLRSQAARQPRGDAGPRTAWSPEALSWS